MALAMYLGLGRKRSMRGVRDMWGAGAPSISVLEKWSQRDEWREHAKSYDAKADRDHTNDVAIETTARTYNAALLLQQTVMFCLDANLIAQAAQMAARRGDLVALVKSGLEAEKLLQVLSGGVSDRVGSVIETDSSSKQAAEYLREIERRILRSGPIPVPKDAHFEEIASNATEEALDNLIESKGYGATDDTGAVSDTPDTVA